MRTWNDAVLYLTSLAQEYDADARGAIASESYGEARMFRDYAASVRLAIQQLCNESARRDKEQKNGAA
jgi:hypothetical protein